MEKRAFNVLIVDDDPKLQTTMMDILEARGFTGIPASTGKEALVRVVEQDIDVALIDLRLGDMSGLRVLREVKEHSPDCECILLTGYASQESAIEALNLGAYSYI